IVRWYHWSCQLALSTGPADFGSRHRQSSGLSADHFPFFCSKSQSSTLVSLYVGVHASWPTPLYSVDFGAPPAFLMAAIMSRDRSIDTSGSASPWKIQIGSLASFSAWEGSPPALMGIAAANSSGRRETRSHVP